jgi:hypothetical protein
MLMALIYIVLYRERPRRRGTGPAVGATIGLLTAIYWVPSFYAQHAVPAFGPWLAAEGTFFVVQGALAGGAIALLIPRHPTGTEVGKEPRSVREAA